VCIALCTIVAHNIAQNRPDNFPPYPPDNHHISDDVYLREGRIKMPLGTKVDLSPGDFVLDGDPAPYSKKGQSLTQCLAHVVAKRLHGSRWHLVLEVGLGLRNIVFNVDPATPRKRA